MELVTKLIDTQLGNFFPVVIVIVIATLVYTFGFKSPEQPQFDKLFSVDDRKSAGKKRKIKEKKTANGHAVSVSDTKNEKANKDKEVKRSPTKDIPDTPKKTKKESNTPKQATDLKKSEPVKQKSVEEVKNKKNKNKFEKPVDYDDGDWETVPNKNEKKKKVDSPVKKEKKVKSQEKSSDIKEKIENQKKSETEKQLSDNNKENKPNENTIKKNVAKIEVSPKETKEIMPTIEETKLHKEKKPKKEKVVVEEVAEVPVPAVVNKIETEKKVQNDAQEIKTEPVVPESKQPSGAAVFDELGDAWTEAKAVKKSKKKSRRD